MKKSLVITDVTRMQEGRVCIAGYDAEGRCIRPVLPPPGIHERTLYAQGRPIVFPFAVVEYELTRPLPRPPHTEDHEYDPRSVRFIKRLESDDRRETLEKTLFKSIAAIFEEPIFADVGHYVMDGRGPRSLGTIRPQRVARVIHEPAPDGKWQYRLRFSDSEGTTYRLTVTDLAWRYYHDRQRESGHKPGEISSVLTAALKSSEVYLRIGLARGWDKFPDRCFLQITGVYTFPDYLGGRTFADFAPASPQS